jgi:protein SCO1/2
MRYYRLGLLVILTTIAISIVACLILVNPRPNSAPSGEDLTSPAHALGPFSLIERDGRSITNTDLTSKVWIAAFVFSRCPSSCPRISKVMKDLQSDLTKTNVVLASLTVDPDYDKPEILRKFADRYGADPKKWLFLTGEKAAVYELILKSFLQSVAESNPEDRQANVEAISHSDRLVLVGPGNQLLGSYHSSEPDAVARLEARARTLDRMETARKTGWVLRLPVVNAVLNGSCAVLLFTGWLLIRSGHRKAHAVCMLLGLAVSALFLTCYLVYHYHVGSVAFRGVGPIRIVYLSMLLSHTVLAIAVVPLILTTLFLALRSRFEDHKRIASVTFPIWMYVSITGVLVYVMLYQLAFPTASF